MQKICKENLNYITAAKFLSNYLKLSTVITLAGPVGSGKSTLVAEVLRLFGVKYERSPTYTLINEYTLGNQLQLWHVDMYRNFTTIVYYLTESSAIKIIEWCPDTVASLLKPTFNVHVTQNHVYSIYGCNYDV